MKIEPSAAECFEQARVVYLKKGKAVPPETMAYIMGLSQAESLKRIADALWGIEGTSGIVELLNGIEMNGRSA